MKLSSQMIKARLQAQSTLFKLSQLLIAQCHIVKYLDGYHLISLASRDVNHIQDAMSFLEEKQRFFKLLPCYKGQGGLIQLQEHDRNLVYSR